MTSESVTLYITAASIGFFHTLLGPDHYVPFIAMSKAGNWTPVKTSLITLVCGIGHVAGSVIIGLVGVVFGVAIMKVEALEAFRGNLAAWALMGFGLVYLIWGLRKAAKGTPHEHKHEYLNGRAHAHEHAHNGAYAHVHYGENKNITPWVLFTIFVLGPCEPLIPLLMYPAAKQDLTGLVIVTAVFGAATLLTMTVIVLALSYGFKMIRLGRAERYVHAVAGAMILLSGAAIQFLGL